MTYRSLKKTVHWGVVLLLVSGVALKLSGQRDLFPLFSWSLFSYVDQQKVDFAILVVGLEGQPLDAPREFMTTTDLFPGAGDMRAYITIQDLGLAVLRRDEATLETSRALFEGDYLKYPGVVDYQVMMRTFDPIERWHQGSFELRPLAQLRTVPRRPRAPAAGDAP